MFINQHAYPWLMTSTTQAMRFKLKRAVEEVADY
jgi:hypothetical protein